MRSKHTGSRSHLLCIGLDILLLKPRKGFVLQWRVFRVIQLNPKKILARCRAQLEFHYQSTAPREVIPGLGSSASSGTQNILR